MLWRWAAILCRNISPPILETQDFFDSFRSCSFMKMHFPFDVQCTPEPHFFSIFHPGWLEVKQNVVKPLRKMMMGLWPLLIPTRPYIFTKELQSSLLWWCSYCLSKPKHMQNKKHSHWGHPDDTSSYIFLLLCTEQSIFVICLLQQQQQPIISWSALHCLLGIAVGKLVVFVPSNYEAIACLAHAFQVPLAMH